MAGEDEADFTTSPISASSPPDDDAFSDQVWPSHAVPSIGEESKCIIFCQNVGRWTGGRVASDCE
eukprot:899711-Rhodomonas_salina.4